MWARIKPATDTRVGQARNQRRQNERDKIDGRVNDRLNEIKISNNFATIVQTRTLASQQIQQLPDTYPNKACLVAALKSEVNNAFERVVRLYLNKMRNSTDLDQLTGMVQLAKRAWREISDDFGHKTGLLYEIDKLEGVNRKKLS